MEVSINKVMAESGVSFGTSGVRGLVKDMTDEVCYSYVSAFLQHMEQQKFLDERKVVAIAGDLRSSTDRIMNACAAACIHAGIEPINLGTIPSPATALYGLTAGIPTIMVTGSHIPDDRNGIKFNTPIGEILKSDEQAIKAAEVLVDTELFESGLLKQRFLPEPNELARTQYVDRYLSLFPDRPLAEMCIGVYQHSSVARDILPEILTALGAKVLTLGRSESFVSVDTEAIRPEDVELAKTWSSEFELDAIVSTDGDADRPLVSDEKGEWLRGDIAGILTAKFVNADYVVTPVSSNSAVEKSQFFSTVKRTRIGSPYVIEAMINRAAESNDRVVGYEANGGFLQQTDADIDGKILPALPTRDAVMVILAVLVMSKQQGCAISDLLSQLPKRYTASDRIKNLPTERSQTWLKSLSEQFALHKMDALHELLPELAMVKEVEQTDGLRLTLVDNNIVHFRPSGNAPELRCYTEADSEEAAQVLNRYCLGRVATALAR